MNARAQRAGGIGEQLWLCQETTERVAEISGEKYKYGFVTDIETERAPKGLNEDTVRFISAKKDEPEWMLEWRLEAFQRWQEMTRAELGARALSADRLSGRLLLRGAQIAAPSARKSLDEVDPKLLETYEKLGIPLSEQKLLAGRGGRCGVRLASRSRPPSRQS